MYSQQFNHGITGFVKSGFEPLIQELEKFYEMGYEKNCQLCIYVAEEIVVDVVMANPDPKNSKVKTKID